MNKFLFGLLKSGEEGAELAQVVLKMMAYDGEYEDVDGNILFEKVVEEFGDVRAAQVFAFNSASQHFRQRVTERATFKLKKFEQRFIDVP